MSALKAHLTARRNQPHQVAAMQALCEGLHLHGVDAGVYPDWTGCELADLVVSWNDRAPPECCDKPRLMLEAGYINGSSGDYTADRLRFISTSWNALHNRADVPAIAWPADRWQRLGLELVDWKTAGEYVLLLAQFPGDSNAPTAHEWQRIRNAMIAHRWQWRERTHPLQATNKRSLAADLGEAALAVTWSSTAAVEAVVAGVPTVTFDFGAMAWPVSSHSFRADVYRGPREQWAYNLAYRQWTLAELASGEAWQYIGIQPCG